MGSACWQLLGTWERAKVGLGKVPFLPLRWGNVRCAVPLLLDNMSRSVISSITCRGSWPFALLVVLITLVAMADSFSGNKIKAQNQPSNGRVLVKKGESLPLYSYVADEEDKGIIEGIRTLGEWMKTAGLLLDESPIIETHLDPSEVFELEGLKQHSQEMQFKTLSRDDAPTMAPVPRPTPTLSELACSRRGVLLNKTGLVVRIYNEALYLIPTL
jgi:hypothetical protein